MAKPKLEIRRGLIKVRIWQRRSKNGVRYSLTIGRLFRNGDQWHYSTVYRWVTKGSRGRKLESVLVGGVRYTTVEALERFLCCGSCPSISTDSEMTRAINAALDSAGL